MNDSTKPAASKIIDHKQCGAIPNNRRTDGYGASLRIILFDYCKTFDLIDHEVLVRKLYKLGLPISIINRIIGFISNRFQRIKIGNDYTCD